MQPNFQALFESAPGLYLVLTPGFEIVAVSDAYLKATMVERRNILGKALFEVFPDNPDDPHATGTNQLRASLQRVLKNTARDVMAIQKYDIRRPDGTFEERHWSPVNSPVLGLNGQIEYIIHQVEDVTDFVRLKKEGVEQHRIASELRSEVDHLEKQRQSQRLEALGQLAGGVAHDFNNILATIMIVCENAMAAQGVPAAVTENLKIILQGSERAATLTRQLLAFSRKQVLQPKVLNVNGVVENFRKLLGRTLNENYKLDVQLAPNLWNTVIDAGQVEQIILNLAVNARDAMPNGGAIRIRTENVVLDKAMSKGHMEVKPGSYAMLSVSDSGVGMDAATQARIFEPFFTTKGHGKGTGLGLATVYGIVEQNKGTIWVYSEPFKGSVFKIYLPQALGAVPEESVKLAPDVVPAANKRTIMVAEDEKELRAAIISILASAGYKILEAFDGENALELLEKCDYQVDLIISDVVMPEMGGQELAKTLASRGKKMRILFLSGYTEDVLEMYGVSGSDPHFLEKPFTMRVLLEKVADVLAAKSTCA